MMEKKESVIYNPLNIDEQKVSDIADLKGCLKGIVPENITDKEIGELRLEDRRKKYENLP